MRKWFAEEYISENGIMSEETATSVGYVKILDYKRTKDSLMHNMAVIDHATQKLKPLKKFLILRPS
jgi:hypothetical protein